MLIFIIIGVVLMRCIVFIIRVQTKKRRKKRRDNAAKGYPPKQNEFQEWKDFLIAKYGKMDAGFCSFLSPKKNNSIYIFDSSKKIIINGKEYNYSDIMDFAVNNQMSYKTSNSTGSMIARGIVGGVLFGGVGALVGATTAKKNTTSDIKSYNIDIYIKSINCPIERYKPETEDATRRLVSYLKIIIDSNQNLGQ